MFGRDGGGADWAAVRRGQHAPRDHTGPKTSTSGQGPAFFKDFHNSPVDDGKVYHNLLLILSLDSTRLALVGWVPLQLQLLQELVVEMFHRIVTIEIRLPSEILVVADEAGEYCEVFSWPGHHRGLQKLDNWKIAR